MIRMRSLMLLVAISGLSASAPPAVSAQITNPTPETLTIGDTTYENVRWGRQTPTTITIFHKSGVATIPLSQLPKDLQTRFGYDPQKVVEWQKGEAERMAAEKLRRTPVADPLKVGMVGISRNGEFKVIQVVGPDEMLAEVSAEYEAPGPGYDKMILDPNDGTYTRVPIPGPMQKDSKPKEVWIKGVSTQGLIDGMQTTRWDVFKVTGTKTYRTPIGGSETVFALAPLASASPATH